LPSTLTKNLGGVLPVARVRYDGDVTHGLNHMTASFNISTTVINKQWRVQAL